MATNRDLYEVVQGRPRPEDVAELILELRGDVLTPSEKRVLNTAARHSLKRMTYAYSSMAASFVRPVGAERMVKKAAELFVGVEPLSASDCLDPGRVEEFMRRITVQIQRVPGQDFKARLTRAQRVQAGIAKGHRAYNKRYRFLIRLEDKIRRMVRNNTKYEHTRMSKSAFATRLTPDVLLRDTDTACFVAYLSARMSLRSVFTNGEQERAYDNIAKMLFDRAVRGTPDWWVMAHVHPEREVLANLSDNEKGALLAMTFESLRGIADFLAVIATESNIDRKRLIVRRGNDSTTWNATAGAWNKAREGWFALLHAMGMESILDSMCPGKVMRLMASDVVRWQVLSKAGYNVHFDWNNDALIDQGLHPDTLVFRDLPMPWEVLNGTAFCPKALVEEVVARHNASNKAMAGGWTGPKGPKHPVAFKPTPELVHGVAVGSPVLAATLRKVGVFSGKGLTGEVPPGINITRDATGAALRVDTASPSV